MQELKTITDNVVDYLDDFNLEINLDAEKWKVDPHLDGMKTYAQDGWTISKSCDYDDLELELSIFVKWHKYPLEVSLNLGLYDSKLEYRKDLGEIIFLTDKIESDWTYIPCICQSIADAYRSALCQVDW